MQKCHYYCNLAQAFELFDNNMDTIMDFMDKLANFAL